MNAITIARRDLASYLQGYSAWFILAVLLLVNGVFFHAYALGADRALLSGTVLEGFFYLTWGFAVATAILLTMRSLADEHALGTEVLLRTSIVKDGEIVVGKWLAAMGMVTLYTLLTAHMPALIYVHGKIAPTHIAVGYAGILLGGGLAASMGVFASALFRNQLAAGIIAGVMAIYTSVIALNLTDTVEPPFSEVVAYTATFNAHFVPFMEGRVTSGSVVFHLSVTALFLFLSTQVLASRRWE
jgi:ABC-2 type transport system permease protein